MSRLLFSVPPGPSSAKQLFPRLNVNAPPRTDGSCRVPFWLPNSPPDSPLEPPAPSHQPRSTRDDSPILSFSCPLHSSSFFFYRVTVPPYERGTENVFGFRFRSFFCPLSSERQGRGCRGVVGLPLRCRDPPDISPPER